jgi:hypothetical protein
LFQDYFRLRLSFSPFELLLKLRNLNILSFDFEMICLHQAGIGNPKKELCLMLRRYLSLGPSPHMSLVLKTRYFFDVISNTRRATSIK